MATGNDYLLESTTQVLLSKKHKNICAIDMPIIYPWLRGLVSTIYNDPVVTYSQGHNRKTERVKQSYRDHPVHCV